MIENLDRRYRLRLYVGRRKPLAQKTCAEMTRFEIDFARVRPPRPAEATATIIEGAAASLLRGEVNRQRPRKVWVRFECHDEYTKETEVAEGLWKVMQITTEPVTREQRRKGRRKVEVRLLGVRPFTEPNTITS